MQISYSERIKIAIIALVFFLASLILLHYTSKDKRYFQYSYKVISSIISPFQSINKNTKNYFKNIFDNYIYLTNLKEQNNELTLKNLSLKKQILDLKEFEFENRNLRRLLNMKRQTRNESIGAEIIGFDSSKWGQAVIIDRGQIDGVKEGDAVVTYEGVAGQVVAVSRSTSKVLLIIDRTSAVDVFLQKTRARGVIEGGKNDVCYLRYVLKNTPIQEGDKVLTSGLDGVFPKGLLVGYVSNYTPTTSGLFETIKVTPSVDFAKLEQVIVLKKKIKKEKWYL